MVVLINTFTCYLSSDPKPSELPDKHTAFHLSILIMISILMMDCQLSIFSLQNICGIRVTFSLSTPGKQVIPRKQDNTIHIKERFSTSGCLSLQLLFFSVLHQSSREHFTSRLSTFCQLGATVSWLLTEKKGKSANKPFNAHLQRSVV